MRPVLAALSASATLVLAACATPPPPAPVPARLLTLTPICLEQLAAFATKATGRKVTLGADTSFAETDQLVLEPPMPRGPDGRPLDGRRIGGPESEVFRLAMVPGGTCTVVHQRTGLQAPLAACSCTPKT
jgi:hypothetical protein